LNFVFLIIGTGIISSILAEIRIRRLVKIVLFITSVLTLFFIIVSITENDISALIGAVWILGLGVITSILIESKTKRLVKIVLLVTSVFASFGIMAFAIRPDDVLLKFTILIIGIGVGILSTLVEKRSKSLFYSSVVIILVGWGIIAVYHGYMHPKQLDPRNVVTNLESFYAVFIGYFFNNTYVSFITLLGGPTIIYPYLQLSENVAGDFPGFIASIVAFHGYKGIILALGWLNAYPELTATVLACMAGIRVGLESFQAVISIRRDGFFNGLKRIKNALVLEIVNTVPKVVALLLIAAVLETVWTQFWVNYWLQHIL